MRCSRDRRPFADGDVAILPRDDRSSGVCAARVLEADDGALRAAAEVLRAGGMVAFPTETVYGLGVDARDDAALLRLFAVKGRPPDNPVIVHVADGPEMSSVASVVTPLARELAARFWPGPLTLVLQARPEISTIATGGLATVGVRVPAHPVATALLRAAAIPLAAPSANRSGRPSPTSAAHVADDLGTDIDLVLDGGLCELGVESTVVDARGEVPVVLREGMVTREQLGFVVDAPHRPAGAADVASPGTRYRHYAPRCRVEVAPVGAGRAVAAALAATGAHVGLVAPAASADAAPAVVTGAEHGRITVLERPRDAGELGAVLYRALRAAEDRDVAVVVVEAVADTGVGRAVMDRLRRAAQPG